MANETLTLMGQLPVGVAEDDYQSFCTALGSSARGRAFLAEYARRNRHADTETVLAALNRMEQAARSQKAEPEAERIRQDLRALLDTLRSARPEIDNSPGAIKSATLAALIDFVQARIEALVTNERWLLAQMSLAQVPDLEQPELPIPQPASAALPPISLVQTVTVPPPAFDSQPADIVHGSEKQRPVAGKNFVQPQQPRASGIIPEVNFVDSVFGKASDNAAPMPAPAKASGATNIAAPPPVEFSPPVTHIAIPAIEPIELIEITKQAAAPKAPTESSYELWLDPPSEIQIDVDVEIDAPADVQTKLNVAAQTGAPVVIQGAAPFAAQVEAPIAWPTAAKPAALSPRQAAIAALAAESEAQQPAADKPPASTPIAAQPAAKPAALSPRQAAIAALAAESEAQQPAADKPPASTPIAEHPAAKPAALSPRQAMIAALTAQSEVQRPAAVNPAAPAATVSPPAQPVTDPLAAIMALSEDERLALFT